MQPRDAAAPATPALGIVVIGRNEGARLERCLRSLAAPVAPVVYVDSGSTDGSVALATRLGATVVALDTSRQFTAARARNAGCARLREIAPEAQYVQFVDGDCEVAPGWIERAGAFLGQHPEVAVVSGRLRERHPERSVYNRLCDLEWERPVGEAQACGGIAMMRVDAYTALHGFREDMIAGEEPELCVRLRAQGWKIWSLAQPMAWHDAAIVRFGQWWKRAKRGGYACATGAWLHGAAPERHGVQRTRSAMLWAVLLPIATLALAALSPAAWLLLLAYPLQVLRLALRDGIGDPGRRLQALFFVVSRFPEAQGVLTFWADRLRGRNADLIEYK